MKISLDTDVDSFDVALRAVCAAYGQPVPIPGATDPASVNEAEALPGGWTGARLRQFAEWLGESDAAVAVRYIAEHAPAVRLDDVFAHMSKHTGIQDFDGKAMGGRMSAVGFARKSIEGGVSPIYSTDYNTRKYRMDTRLAAALLEALDAHAAE